MSLLKKIVDSYMEKVSGIEELCDRCLKTERWGGSVVLMVVDAAFTSIGLNYFTAVVPKVEEFNKKFVENGKIKNLGDRARALARDKRNSKFRDRRGEVLFIDARKLGVMVDRRHRELTPEDIKKIAETYHAWRGELVDEQKVEYKDIPGFCKAVKPNDISKQRHILTPGRYVGAEEEEENGEVFEEKMKKLTWELAEEFQKSGGDGNRSNEKSQEIGLWNMRPRAHTVHRLCTQNVMGEIKRG